MRIERFTGDYERIASLYRSSSADLHARDLRNPQGGRWLAVDGPTVLGAADAVLRPDDRMFLRFRTEAVATAAALSDAVAAELSTSVYATVDESEQTLLAALLESGFEVEMSAERFVVPFLRAIQAVRRAGPPNDYALIPVSQADPDRLFDLDNAVRKLVPGTDGWLGNRAWFDAELRDRSAYVAAMHRGSGAYAGLARIWHNPGAARFGLIGVLPEHRRCPLAATLLHRVLADAATWGYDKFTTETSLSNRVVYPRLVRLGESQGRFHQLVLRPEGLTT